MTTVDLTLLNRTFRQSVDDRSNSYNVNGTSQDDRIEIYNGNIFGSSGNDYLARIDPSSGSVFVNYWNAEKGVRINLAEGWAEDGLGGRDTLVGIASANGSQFDDYFWGDGTDNYFYGQGGHDVIEGGAGVDGIGVAGWLDKTGSFRPAMLSELVIQVSADGRTAVVIDPTGTGQYFKYDLHDVEYVSGLNDNNEYSRLELSGLIKPLTVALTTIAAGPTYRWNLAQPLGTAIGLTYSFMTDSDAATSKRPMSSSEKAAVRAALSLVGSFTGLTFTEVQEFNQSFGQIRLTVSQQSNTKGYTWLPETSNINGQAGDIYMDEESMLYLQPGGEGLQALLHELGHALGLRHPTNVDVNDHWAQVAADTFDSTQWSVMAKSTSSQGLSRIDFGVLDISALRYTYGVKLVNAGDSIYKLADTDGQILRTIIDDGGVDIVDCSSLSTGASVNLGAGKYWDIGLTNDGIKATNNMSTSLDTFLEAVIGTAYDDVLIGNAQNNQFTPGKGNDWIDGAEGVDTVYFDAKKADFFLNKTGSNIELWSANANTGLKTLANVERLVFQDMAMAWDLGSSQHGGESVLLLSALFPGKMAFDVSNQKFIGQVIGLLDTGYSMPAIAGAYLRQDIWSALIGQTISATARTLAEDIAIVKFLLGNIYGVLPDDTTLKTNAEVMHNELVQGTWLAQLALNSTNQERIGLGGLATTGITYFIANTGIGLSYVGTKTNDTLVGGAGNDTIDGGAGTDTAQFQGKLSTYKVSISGANGTVTDSVTARDGMDTLKNIEHLRFADFDINTGIKALAGSMNTATVQRVMELYVAFFNRTPDADGLTYWLGQSKAGVSTTQIAESFYGVGVQYTSLTGFSSTMTTTDFINVVYRNVLGRADGADAGGLQYWTEKLTSGKETRGSLVSTILDAAHTYKGDATYGWVANLLDNKITVATKVAIDWGLNYLTADASVTNGMAIAKAVTPTDITAAIVLVGVPEGAVVLG